MAGTLDRLGTDLRLHLTRNPLQQERQEDKQCFYADSLAFSDSWSYLALSELNSVKQHEPNTRREFLVL